MDSSSSKTSSSKKTDGSSPPDGSGWKETKNTPRERELERKRARGEISCAECRRQAFSYFGRLMGESRNLNM